MDEHELGEIVDVIYQAAIEPELWTTVLSRLADMTGCEGGALLDQNQETGKGVGVTARLDPAGLDAYFGYFATRNVLRRTVNLEQLIQSFRPQILTDEDQLPKAELMASEYYNDFMRPLGIHSVLMVGLDRRGLEAPRPLRGHRYRPGRAPAPAPDPRFPPCPRLHRQPPAA
jgi:hypothetical protein